MGKAKFARKDKHPPAYAPKVTSIERSKLEEIVGMCADRYKRAHPHPGTQAVVAELKALAATTDRVSYGSWALVPTGTDMLTGPPAEDVICGCPLYQITEYDEMSQPGDRISYPSSFYEHFDKEMKRFLGPEVAIVEVRD